MRKLLLISLYALQCVTFANAAVNDTFPHRGIQYKITKEDASLQSFEVSAVHYDSTNIILPDSVNHGDYTYAVTNAIQWYNPQNCSLRHYDIIDMSEAKHITWLPSQVSGLIAIDTLILPPNLQRFPWNFYTSDSLNEYTRLMDEETLLPGIHRVYSTCTQPDEFVNIALCTSLIEADLSSYTTTYSPDRGGGESGCFSNNPFLTQLVLPNTIKVFYDGIFDHDIRLRDVNIPDSLEQIRGIIAVDLPLDTLRLGKKVSSISSVFALGWYNLKHIEVDPDNPYYMSDHGVLYTKDQHWLFWYPYSRESSEYHIPSQTDSIGHAFAYIANKYRDCNNEQYMWKIKQLADSVPLKKVVCHPMMKYLIGWGAPFMSSSVRTMSKFGETQVKTIPAQCFKHSAIDSITLPYGLTEIGAQAFAYTYNLKQVMNLPRLRYLQTIGEGAFRRAWLLSELDLLACNKVLDIPRYMCQGDSLLQFVSLPRHAQSIGESAFAGCVALQQFVCPAVTPIPVTPSVFDGVDKQNCVLKVLPRSLNLYKNAPVWEEFFQMDTTGFYYIETAVSDTLAGSVSEGGAYLEGEYVTITADAKPGYRFVSWDDGFLYSSRTFQVTQDESFTAIFEEIPPTFYTLTVLPNDSTMGEVTGSGSYLEGTQVTLTATPYEGFILRYWSFTDLADETILYTMPPFNATVRAFFVPRDKAIDQITTNQSPITNKIIRDNRIFILRGDKIYTLTGQQVK